MFSTKTLNGTVFAEVKQLEEEARQIASDWNGKDETYFSGGDVFTEDDAHVAEDIADAAKHLMNLLEDLDF